MKKSYAGHNSVYQKLRGTEAVGWDRTEEAYQERFNNLAKVLPKLALPQHPLTLELGCGAGNISVWLSQKGHIVTGLDIAPDAIAWARERAEQEQQDITFVTGDLCTTIRDLPAKFDFVFDSHLLHCIIGDDRPPLLQEVRRVLRPGGLFLVDTMCGPVLNPEEICYCPQTKVCTRSGITTRYIGDVADLENELTTAGFSILFTDVYEKNNTQTVFIACR